MACTDSDRSAAGCACAEHRRAGKSADGHALQRPHVRPGRTRLRGALRRRSSRRRGRRIVGGGPGGGRRGGGGAGGGPGARAEQPLEVVLADVHPIVRVVGGGRGGRGGERVGGGLGGLPMD